MRLSKTPFYPVVLISLLLGVFCSEISESYSLNDDPTNDFVEDSAAPGIHAAQKVRKAPECGVRSSSVEERVPRFLAIDPVELTPLSAPNLLRLFSVQRK